MPRRRPVLVVGSPPAPPSRPMPRWVVVRLIANAVLGVVLLAWLRAHTNWGDAAGTLLALGGILSWLAFVGKLFDDDRQKQIRRFLADWLFESPKAWVTTGVLSGLFVLTLGVGSVEVVNQQGGDAVFRVYPTGTKPPEADTAERVPVGGRDRRLYFVNPFRQRPRMVAVKVNGLPTEDFPLLPWWRNLGPERVAVPGSFLRPVVLVLSHQDVYQQAAKLPFKLVIFVGGEQVYEGVYQAKQRHSVLLGRASAIENPEWAQDSDVVKGVKIDTPVVEAQFPPVGWPADLNAGDEVRAVLLNAEGKPAFQSRAVRAQQPENRDRILQLLVIRNVVK